MTGDVTVALASRAELAEGPLWDPVEQVLWWVNIKAREIHRFDPASGADRMWHAPSDAGSLALRAAGGLVVALQPGFFFSPEQGSFAAVAEPEPERRANRFNDGKPDRHGRFWAGSLHEPETEPSGALYRLDPDLSCHRMVDGIIASNGLAFSPDGTTLYYADSGRRIVWAFDCDPDDGTLANRRVFIELAARDGAPDGAAIDAEGCYWLAHAGGWRVVRYDPKGRADRVVTLPVALPTCPAFGGADLRTLYVTTGTYRLPAAEIASQPLAGHLLAIDTDVAGLPDARFAG